MFWNGPDTARVYVWGENSPLKRSGSPGEVAGRRQPQGSAFGRLTACPAGCWPCRRTAATAGTGIVWAVVPLDGDANQQRGVKGIVLALDAQDVIADAVDEREQY